MKFSKSLVAAAVALAALQAHALTVTVTAGPSSTQFGAVTADFDGSTPAGWSYTGGALFTTSSSGITAVPPGSTGNFWSIGPSGGQPGPGVVNIVPGAKYYGFLWGSPDGYNTVEFFNGAASLGSYDGSIVYPPADGTQSVGKYLNAFVGVGEVITSVKFTSSQNAFETDNHAIVAVPEPETYALMLAGLAAVGFVSRRRSA